MTWTSGCTDLQEISNENHEVISLVIITSEVVASIILCSLSSTSERPVCENQAGFPSIWVALANYYPSDIF